MNKKVHICVCGFFSFFFYFPFFFFLVRGGVILLVLKKTHKYRQNELFIHTFL